MFSDHRLRFLGLRSNRKSKALQSLSRVPPTSAEAEALHSLYLARGQEDQEHPDPNRVWMSDSRQENTMLMFPQERKYVATCPVP